MRRDEVDTPVKVRRRQRWVGGKEVGGLGVLVETAAAVKARARWSTRMFWRSGKE